MDIYPDSTDYGKDITDLATSVAGLHAVVFALQQEVKRLRKQLEDQGMLYGGTVAYSTTYVDNSLPKSVGGWSANRVFEHE